MRTIRKDCLCNSSRVRATHIKVLWRGCNLDPHRPCADCSYVKECKEHTGVHILLESPQLRNKCESNGLSQNCYEQAKRFLMVVTHLFRLLPIGSIRNEIGSACSHILFSSAVEESNDSTHHKSIFFSCSKEIGGVVYKSLFASLTQN